MKKETEKFKAGDLVRVIDTKGLINSLVINRIYIVDSLDKDQDFCIYLDKKFNNLNVIGGYLSKRFKKVSAKDMTEEEKSKYINYKLGVNIGNNNEDGRI